MVTFLLFVDIILFLVPKTNGDPSLVGSHRIW